MAKAAKSPKANIIQCMECKMALPANARFCLSCGCPVGGPSSGSAPSSALIIRADDSGQGFRSSGDGNSESSEMKRTDSNSSMSSLLDDRAALRYSITAAPFVPTSSGSPVNAPSVVRPPSANSNVAPTSSSSRSSTSPTSSRSSLFSAFGSDNALFLSTSAKYGADANEGMGNVASSVSRGRDDKGVEGGAVHRFGGNLESLKESDDNWENDMSLGSLGSLLDETN